MEFSVATLSLNELINKPLYRVFNTRSFQSSSFSKKNEDLLIYFLAEILCFIHFGLCDQTLILLL
jgi:hypothetical protein